MSDLDVVSITMLNDMARDNAALREQNAALLRDKECVEWILVNARAVNTRTGDIRVDFVLPNTPSGGSDWLRDGILASIEAENDDAAMREETEHG